MSVRLRITLWYTGLLSLVLVVFAILVYAAVAQQLSSQMEYAIHTQALDAARTVHATSLGQEGADGRLQLQATPALGNRKLYVQLVDPSGKVLAASDNVAQSLPIQPASLRSALDGQEVHTTLSLSRERLDLYSTPLLVDGKVMAVLQVAASLQPLEFSLGRLQLALVVIVLGAVALAAAIGWFLATKAMRPVDRITQAALTIGHSANLSQRLPEPQQRDEIGRLAAAFNEMLGELERALAAQRDFLADASHELRTPLAAVRANIETLLRYGDANPGERAHTLRVIVREIDRMGRLITDLLTLARADAGQPLMRRRVALDRLLLGVYQQAMPLANGVQLGIGELEQVEADVDPDRIRQLMLNLVDNAFRYTPSGGSVTMDLVRRDGWVVFRVRDTGQGIPAEQLPRIFERFYRVDRPRSRSTGGTGLGLAICRWVAEAHGGRIEVESREGVGSIFTVLLPLENAVGDPCPSLPTSTDSALGLPRSSPAA